MCGTLCLQHGVNESLDKFVKDQVDLVPPDTAPPQHLSFI
jgi:hypothetical protein